MYAVDYAARAARAASELGADVVAREENMAVHQQIAVGVRDPGKADAALEFAFDEAALRGARLRVVHAWHWLPELRPIPSPVRVAARS